MSKGITIQFQRIKSLYQSGTTTPVVINVPDVNGTYVNMNVTDFILMYGEPLYVEDTGFLFVGDGVITYDTEGNKSLTGTKIQGFLDNHKYFVRAVDGSIYGDYTYEKEISTSEESDAGTTRIANTKFVRDSINALTDTLTGTPATSKTITAFDEEKGKVKATFSDISIGYTQINNASPSNASPKEDATAASGTSNDWSRADHVHPHDTTKANLKSPEFTGTPTAPTNGTATDTSKQIATDAFVWNAIKTLDVTDQGTASSKTITSLAETDGKISYTPVDISIKYSQINDTKFAVDEVDKPKADGDTAVIGSINRWAKADHIHPHDTTKADKTGTITDVKYATAVSSSTDKSIQYSKANASTTYQDIVTISTLKSDMALNKVENYSKAEILASAALTGTPTAPTATTGTNNTQVATTAFVNSSISAYSPYTYDATVTADNITTKYPPETTKVFIIDSECRQWFSTGTEWKICSTTWGNK